MRILFTLTLFLTFINFSFADSVVTKIEGEDLVCEDEGVKLAFDFADYQNQEKVRVWQADKGDKEGIELKTTYFMLYRCPHCYDVEAEMTVFNQKVNYLYKISGLSFDGAINANINVLGHDGTWKKVKSVPCTTVTHEE